MIVRPKKSLGQHFLRDENIAKKIIGCISDEPVNILEIGPGTGVLSKYLFANKNLNVRLVETDKEAVDYLLEHYPQEKDNIFHDDFLASDAGKFFNENYTVIGNFPYNISSQIFFKVLSHRNQVSEVVCMIQKEVAERISSPPGNKSYGILSVLLQSYYDIEYLFTVSEHVFIPPPRVKSAVIRLRRNNIGQLACNEAFFFRLVKAGFNQRRKTLRNALKPIMSTQIPDHELLSRRAEQLTVDEFVELTKIVDG